MGERMDFWAFLRTSRRTAEAWEYRPATGRPVRIWIGRITSDPGGRWFVYAGHRQLDPLACRDEAEARGDRHDQAVQLMEICGPGRWAQVPPD